jgi:hypothetical protein
MTKKKRERENGHKERDRTFKYRKKERKIDRNKIKTVQKDITLCRKKHEEKIDYKDSLGEVTSFFLRCFKVSTMKVLR